MIHNLGWWRKAVFLFAAAAWLAGDATAQSNAAHGATGAACRVMANACLVREPADREWHLMIRGSIPSLCGAYLLVLDARGKIVHQGVIPHGEYPEASPLVVSIPKDGIAGDYEVKFIGRQDDLLGILYPVSDLPEVYRSPSSTGHSKDALLWFQVPPGQTEATASAYKAHMLVKDSSGRVVADTRNGQYGGDKYGAKYRFSNYVTFPVSPGTLYSLHPDAMYFGLKPDVYATFNPAGWFFPDPALASNAWWRIAGLGK